MDEDQGRRNTPPPDEWEDIRKQLRDFAESLASAGPNEDKLVEAAVEACRVAMEAEQCSVWLVAGAVLRPACLRGYQGPGASRYQEIEYALEDAEKPESGITLWIWHTQQTVSANSHEELRVHPAHAAKFDKPLHDIDPLASDASEQERQSYFRGHPCQQFYGGPITIGDQRLGVLKVENRRSPSGESRPFSQAQMAALDSVAAMLAMALKHAREAVGHFRFTIHSLRNDCLLLNTVVSLLSGQHDEDAREASRQAKAVMDAIDFYDTRYLRFFRGSMEFSPTDRPESLAKLIRDEVYLAGQRVRKGIFVTQEVTDDICFPADAAWLAVVLKEAIRNAEKAITGAYHWSTHQTGQIIVSLKQIGDPPHPCISVQDTGELISDSELRHDFQQTWPRQVGGRRVDEHGFGLWIMNWVAEQHGGCIDFLLSPECTTLRIHLGCAKKAQGGCPRVPGTLPGSQQEST